MVVQLNMKKHYTAGFGCQIKNLDDVLQRYLGYKTDGVFVEVGAFDCYQWSNTWGLAILGWKGLYFEPQLGMYFDCLKRLKDYPNTEAVHMALSNWVGETDLFLGGSISTISKEQKDIYLRGSWSSVTGLADNKTERVSVSTLASQLAARRWPASYDLLVVDVEGSEMAVLEGNDIDKYRPTLAIVETHADSEEEELSYKARHVDEYFRRNSYVLVQQDTINSIYSI